MKPHSRVAASLPRSGIREVMELASKREGVIHLEVGEPSFNTPQHIIAAAFAASEAGKTKYTPNAGLPSVRAAVAERYASRWGRPVAVEQTLVTAGAVNAIAAMVLTLCEEGDEILIPDPGWPNYVGIATLARANPIRYALRPENGWLPDPDELRRLITPRTKVLIACNPSNPTGAVFPAETVEALVALTREEAVYLISDEIYEDLVFDGLRHAAAARSGEPHVIAVSGCSKSYAMTGWRLGWAIADPAPVAIAAKVQEGLVSCASSISQCAAEAAIRGPQTCVEEMRAAYERRRDAVRDLLAPAGLLPTVPHGAFYALVDLRGTGIPSRRVVVDLLEEEGVATAPGVTFGDVSEGMIRISLATADDLLVEGCRRLLRFAERHGAVPAVAR
jgi:aspartate/methionine/tyrosine aminotransferase